MASHEDLCIRPIDEIIPAKPRGNDEGQRAARRKLRRLRRQRRRLQQSMRVAARWQRWRRHRVLADRLEVVSREFAAVRHEHHEARQVRWHWRRAQREYRRTFDYLGKLPEPGTRRWVNIALLRRLSMDRTIARYLARLRLRQRRLIDSPDRTRPTDSVARGEPPSGRTGGKSLPV
ncbi:MAG: hypothetical protein MJE77_31955 [Proteobacteria bacterium]|nr:hypothetical protein [Pseudomonadota bacterium]